MFSSLVRWLGRGSAGREAGSAPRFTPRLEALEDRALPGGLAGAVVMQTAAHAALSGAAVGWAGGTLPGFEVLIARSIGEEIPQ
jgi:hypothetical protein